MYQLPKFLKIAITLGLCLSLWTLATQTVWAKDFQADYTVDYTLDTQNESIHVTQHITLTNNQPGLRASSYSLTLEKDSYLNIKASDSRGVMSFTESDTEDDSKLVTFTFNDRVVGQGNRLRWTIEYDSKTIARHNGQMWDIAIPRIKEHPSYDIASYTVNLHTPSSLGEVHYLTPQAASYKLGATTNTYTFNKDHLMAAGIMASYGKAQVFEFELTYHLANPNIGQASTEIALPPDIQGYQQIIYGQLNPQPASMRTDQDGNALATYYLGPQASIDVTFSGWARIDPRKPKLDSPHLVSDLPQELVDNYTVAQRYWETDDPKLQQIVDEITDPQKPVVENARAIYQYVTKTLSYNTGRINADLARMGASAAINDPDNAVCMEFTDLFITLARIAGIPAREIDGYAYTTGNNDQPIFYPDLGSDILHAWAQIYLPEDGWVMVDPTWGSTTEGVDFFGQVDLNRIAFAIKGLSSQQPYAAGAYKTSSEQDGDVNVTFSQEDKIGQPDLAIELTTSQSLANLTNQPQIKITNTGSTTLYQLQINATKQDPKNYLAAITDQVPRLLPGQTHLVTLQSDKKNWWSDQQIPLDITVNSTDFYQQDHTHQHQATLTLPSTLVATILPIMVLIALISLATAIIWLVLHWLHQRSNRPPSSDLPINQTATITSQQ